MSYTMSYDEQSRQSYEYEDIDLDYTIRIIIIILNQVLKVYIYEKKLFYI